MVEKDEFLIKIPMDLLKWIFLRLDFFKGKHVRRLNKYFNKTWMKFWEEELANNYKVTYCITVPFLIKNGEINFQQLFVVYKMLAELNFVEQGFSDLFWAITCDQRDTVKKLIEQDPSRLNKSCINNSEGKSHKFSPLVIAINNGHTTLAEWLLTKGANCPTEQFAKINLLDIVVKKNLQTLFPLLFDKMFFNLQRSNTSSLLLQAAAIGNIEKTEYLIAEGKRSVNECYCSHTPLMEAVKYNRLEMVKFLVDNKGARVNVKAIYNRQKLSPLAAAVDKGNLEVVTFLIEKGADVNQRNLGQTIISIAINKGHKTIEKLLREKGAFTLQDLQSYVKEENWQEKINTLHHKQCEGLLRCFIQSTLLRATKEGTIQKYVCKIVNNLLEKNIDSFEIILFYMMKTQCFKMQSSQSMWVKFKKLKLLFQLDLKRQKSYFKRLFNTIHLESCSFAVRLQLTDFIINTMQFPAKFGAQYVYELRCSERRFNNFSFEEYTKLTKLIEENTSYTDMCAQLNVIKKNRLDFFNGKYAVQKNKLRNTAPDKFAILYNFESFFKSNPLGKSKKIVAKWLPEYKKEHPGKNPFAVLNKHQCFGKMKDRLDEKNGFGIGIVKQVVEKLDEIDNYLKPATDSLQMFMDFLENNVNNYPEELKAVLPQEGLANARQLLSFK